MPTVPFYRQTSELSCGPACLLMVLNYYDKKYRMTKKLEWKIWRESTLLAWKGAHPYGLAIAALKRDFKVSLLRESKAFWKDVNCPKNNKAIKHTILRQEKEAKKIGLEERMMKRIGLRSLSKYLKSGIPPIVLVREIKDNSLDCAHWVVVTDIEKNKIFLNDPYRYSNEKLSKELFKGSWNICKNLKEGFNKEVLLLQKNKEKN